MMSNRRAIYEQERSHPKMDHEVPQYIRDGAYLSGHACVRRGVS